MTPPRTTALEARVLLLLAVGLLALLASAGPAAATSWVWPLAGPHTVSRPFGLGSTPYAAGHRGADLPGEPGEPVLTAGAGRVSYAGLLAGRGVVVVVHGVLRTTYEPVTPVVSVGQPVAAGQQIATLDPGHEGCPVVACLHWGLLRGDVYLDPVELVDGGPVRLLPRSAPAGPAAGFAGVPAPLLDLGGLAVTLPEPAALPAAVPDAPGVPDSTGGSMTPIGSAARMPLPTAAVVGYQGQAAARAPSAPGHDAALVGSALALLFAGARTALRARARAGPRAADGRAPEGREG